ncbi:cupin domain-containing protein [Maliponia aquimaris]|uniref:Cupin domain protein n=1 Tax=Maliponia aquimaris TaxID=1673631 RepID=A0A238K2S9_9RHOB|nr:cupin domain-containing protein [Maliponia aquimaris]SMX36767.1 Cupin domain protein [Maliponia aquimaris]
MDYPPFMQALPALDIPFPEDVVSARAVRSDQALVVYFAVHQPVELPEHSHGAQWGHMFHGRMSLTIGGKTRECRPGDSWNIPAGVPHSARIEAGSLLMDVFEEPDRYPLKG